MAQFTEKKLLMKDGREFSIRSAGKADAQLVLDYISGVLTDAPYIYISSQDFKMTLEDEEKFLEALDQSKSGIMLIALLEGKIIGNIDVRSSPWTRVKHRVSFGMSVSPQYRGEGIGRLLVEEMIKFAKLSDEIEKVELGVISKNQPAINLYQSIGFKEEGRSIKGFCSDEGEYLDEIHMGLWVKPNHF